MYRLAQYRYFAALVLFSFFMSFSITLAIPSATADEVNQTTTVAASESFSSSEIGYSDPADRTAVSNAVAANWTFQMLADPALGNPTLTVFFGSEAVSASGYETGSDGSGNSIWQFNVSYAADPMPEMSGARVDYVVVMETAPTVEAPAPSSSSPGNPGDSSNPDQGDSSNPDQGDSNDPGQGDSSNPDQGDSNDPGQGDSNDPGQDDSNDPGQGDSNDPGQGDSNDPGQGDSNDPGQGDSNDPGQGDSNDPGQGDSSEADAGGIAGGYTEEDPDGLLGPDPYDVVFDLQIINVTVTEMTGFEAFAGLTGQDLPIDSLGFPDRRNSDSRVGTPQAGKVYRIFEYDVHQPPVDNNGRGGNGSSMTELTLTANYSSSGTVSESKTAPPPMQSDGYFVLVTDGEDSLIGVTLKAKFAAPAAGLAPNSGGCEPGMDLRLDCIVADSVNLLTIEKYWWVEKNQKSLIPEELGFTISDLDNSGTIVGTASISRDDCLWTGWCYKGITVVAGLETGVQYQVTENLPAGFTGFSIPTDGKFKFSKWCHEKTVSYNNWRDCGSHIICVNKSWTDDTHTQYDCNFILLKYNENDDVWVEADSKTLPAGDSSLCFLVEETGKYWVGEQANNIDFELSNTGEFESKEFGGSTYWGYEVNIGQPDFQAPVNQCCCPQKVFINRELPKELLVRKVYDPDNTGYEAEFELWARDTVTENEWLVKTQTTVGHETSFDMTGLPSSSDAIEYYLIETANSGGYNEYASIFHEKQLVTVPGEVTVTNSKGRITVIKTFSDGLNQEVTFHLFLEGSEIAQGNTADNGSGQWEVVFSGLSAGSYSLTEDTPSGYTNNLSTAPFSLVIGHDITINVVNTKTETPPGEGPGGEEPGTPGEPGEPGEPEEPGTPATPETTTIPTTPTAVIPTVAELIPETTALGPQATEVTPAETAALPSTGAGSSTGIALLAMMMAMSGAILRRAGR